MVALGFSPSLKFVMPPLKGKLKSLTGAQVFLIVCFSPFDLYPLAELAVPDLAESGTNAHISKGRNI